MSALTRSRGEGKEALLRVLRVSACLAGLTALAAPALAGSGGRHGDASPADIACQASVHPRAMSEESYRAWVAGVVVDATAVVIPAERAAGLIEALNFAAPEVASRTEAFIRFDAPSRPATSLVVALGGGCALGDGVFDAATLDELLGH